MVCSASRQEGATNARAEVCGQESHQVDPPLILLLGMLRGCPLGNFELSPATFLPFCPFYTISVFFCCRCSCHNTEGSRCDEEGSDWSP